ncbi:MAG: hypothetical protein KIT27_07470 [Legionellales bacterium]|nr:hypothetical protein [Legionellales bacterium]
MYTQNPSSNLTTLFDKYNPSLKITGDHSITVRTKNSSGQFIQRYFEANSFFKFCAEVIDNYQNY